MKRLARFFIYTLWLFCWFFLGTLIYCLVSGCGVVHSDGQGRVGLGDCDIIVNDTLGTIPKRHGGPVSKAQEGDGIECVLWRFN